MINRITYSILLLFLITLFNGCVDFQYTGQVFEPIDANEPIHYFESRSEIPLDDYSIIGRGVIVDKQTNMDKYDAKEILLKEARKYGANAVALVGVKYVKKSLFDIHENDFSPNSVEQNFPTVDNVSWNNENSLEGETSYDINLEVKALFLLSKDKLKQELILRDAELKDIQDDKQ